MGWGWSLVGWLGGLSLVGFMSLGSLLLLCGSVAHPRGSTPLQVGVFSLVFDSVSVGF